MMLTPMTTISFSLPVLINMIKVSRVILMFPNANKLPVLKSINMKLNNSSSIAVEVAKTPYKAALKSR